MKYVPKRNILMSLLLGTLIVLLFVWYASNKETVEIDDQTPAAHVETEPARAISIELEELTNELSSPTDIASTGNPDDNRLFVVERSGLVQIFENSSLMATPFLDISSQVINKGEQGLLSLAFHPDYETNGLLYVNAVVSGAAGPRTAVIEFKVSSDANRVDPNSQREVITYSQPFENHNGGDLVFDSKGYLYIASGDGGSRGDPNNNAQNTATLLGGILKIDPRNSDTGPYRTPSDNPFVNDPQARDELWAYGLRNPWRISIDSNTELLYIADVGQNSFEEINRVALDAGGANFGWRCYEAASTFDSTSCETDLNHTVPYLAYEHEGEDCTGSITGGEVYRGDAYPNLQGYYVFADFCTKRIYTASTTGTPAFEAVGTSLAGITSFGIDNNRELYAVTIGDKGGALYKVMLGE